MTITRKDLGLFALSAVIVFGVLFILFYLAIATPIFKRKITQAEAVALSNKYLVMAGENPRALAEDFSSWSQVTVTEVAALVAATQFADPENILVNKIENGILVGGLDEASITRIYGTYTCGVAEAGRPFQLMFMYDKERNAWELADFFVVGCK
jgi:hypothetical protein